MEYVSVFPFSINTSGEVVILVRREEDFYKGMGGHTHNYSSPIHAAAHSLLHHSHGLIAPSNIERLLKKTQVLETSNEYIVREVLAKLVTLPLQMCIRNVSNHFGYMFPVPYIDPEILNTNISAYSLHWIRLSVLFSVEEYQRFFTAFDLAVLSQINTNLLRQCLTVSEQTPEIVTHYIALINLEQDAKWQYHLESLVLSNCLHEIYRTKEVRWIYYESELPSSQELEKITCIVAFGWKDNKNEAISEFLQKNIQRKKILALGSAADILCDLLGGQTESIEESPVPELSTVKFDENYANIPFVRNNTSRSTPAPEEGEMYLLKTKNLVKVPEDSQVIARTPDGVSSVYVSKDTMCVHGHPEFSQNFLETMLSKELVEKGNCTEEDIEAMKASFQEKPIQRLEEVRQVCEFFLMS